MTLLSTVWTDSDVAITYQTLLGREGLLKGHGTFWLGPDVKRFTVAPIGGHAVRLRYAEAPVVILIRQGATFTWQRTYHALPQ